MDIKIIKQNDTAIIQPTGDLVSPQGCALLRERIYEVIKGNFKKVVMDMDRVKYINSIGIAALIGGYSSIKSCGGELKFANMSDKVKGVLSITKLDQVFHMYEKVGDAVTSF